MILEKFNLKDKVAIVTGASKGLGQGIALGLADAGANIVGVDILDMAQTKAKVEALNRNFLDIKADLINIEPIQKIIDETVEQFNKIDILVNNAGIIRRADAIEFSEKDWDDVMNIKYKFGISILSGILGKERVADFYNFIKPTRISYFLRKNSIKFLII